MVTAVNTLPVSDLIDVEVILTPQSAQAQNLSTLLLLSSSQNIIDMLERYRIYTTLAQVVADFVTGNVIAAATAYFSQVPKPKQLIIGKWARGSTPAQLQGAPGVTASKTIAQWQAITAGAFDWTVDGTLVHVTGLNFAAVLDLNGVAAVVDAGLSNADCVYNAVLDRFEFDAHSIGTASSLSFTAAPTTGGTNISSSLFASASAAPAAYLVPGFNSESPVTAATLFDQVIGRQWYGMAAEFTSDADVVLFSQYMLGARNKHVFVHTTDDVNTLLSPSLDSTSVAQLLHGQGNDRCFMQFASNHLNYAAISGFARLMTVDYEGSNTATSLMFKNEPGITPENLSETQAAALKAKGVNVFAAYDNGKSILQYGTMVSGIYADQRTIADWLATTLETDQFNALYTSTTGIPQTDPGMHLLQVTSEARLSKGVRNGSISPGVWNSDGFGTLKTGDYMATGFYVYQGLVSDQSEEDRAARKATPQQVAAKLSGAVHSANVTVTLNP